MGRSCGAPSVHGNRGCAEPRGPREGPRLEGAAASLCTLSPCPQPTSCHPDVSGDHVTTGVIRTPPQLTLSLGDVNYSWCLLRDLHAEDTGCATGQ